MDKKFLDELADKMENMQFLSAELDKTRGHDVDGVKADYEEARMDLEGLLLEWVEMQVTDTKPKSPHNVPAYTNAVAQKGSELGLLLIDAGNYLLDCAKRWKRYNEMSKNNDRKRQEIFIEKLR